MGIILFCALMTTVAIELLVRRRHPSLVTDPILITLKDRVGTNACRWSAASQAPPDRAPDLRRRCQ